MKIEQKEQQKSKIARGQVSQDLNGMLCSLCQEITLSVCHSGLTFLLLTSQCGHCGWIFTGTLFLRRCVVFQIESRRDETLIDLLSDKTY